MPAQKKRSRPSPHRISAAALAKAIERSQRAHDRVLLRCFKKLRAIDPALVDRAIQTLDSEESAAQWFGYQAVALGGISPFTAVAQGKRDAVMDLLGLMEHDFLS